MIKIQPYLTVMFILLAAALACIALLGSYTRLHADDFCIAADAHQMDFLSFYAKWYRGWTGRFAYIPAAGLLALGGPRMAALLPPITIAVWYACLTWAALPGFHVPHWAHPKLYAASFAGLFLLVLFSATPNLFQSVFWKDGLINYSFPLVGMTFSIGWMLRIWLDSGQKISTIKIAGVIFLCALVSGGFSEIFSTTQVAFYAILILAALILLPTADRRRMLPILISGLLGGVFAYALVLSAPGNQVRQNLIADHPALLRLVTFSLRNGLVIIAKFFAFTPQWAALSILIPFLAGFGLHQPSPPPNYGPQSQLPLLQEQSWCRAGIALPLMAFLLCVAACAPVAYMLNAYPDDRSILIPLYFIIAALTVSSGLWGYGLRKKRLWPKKFDPDHWQQILMALSLIFILAGCVLSITDSISRLDDFRDYASRWDQRHEQLSSLAKQGVRDATAFGLENRFGISDLREEVDYWVNRCMADYYGFSSLAGK